MFKAFIGYHLEEQRRNAKYIRREATKYQRLIKLIFCVIMMLVLWNIPAEYFGMSDLTVVEQRTISVFCFATITCSCMEYFGDGDSDIAVLCQ